MPATSSHAAAKRGRRPAAHTAAGASTASRGSKTSERSGPATQSEAAAESPMPNGGWAGALRQPMAWSLQSTMALLHAGEEMQRAQLDCWHMALKRHEDAHQRLLGCRDSSEMAALSAELMRFDSANMTHLSQRWMDSLMHYNTAVARHVATMLSGGRSNLLRGAFEALQSGMRTGIKPLDDIFGAPVLRELVQPLAAGNGAARPSSAPARTSGLTQETDNLVS